MARSIAQSVYFQISQCHSLVPSLTEFDLFGGCELFKFFASPTSPGAKGAVGLMVT